MKYYLYIIETIKNTLYCGITNNLLKRFVAHKKGRGAKYTKANKPKKIALVLIFEDKSKALKEEYRIKHLTKEKKLSLIEENRINTIKILKNEYFTIKSSKCQ